MTAPQGYKQVTDFSTPFKLTGETILNLVAPDQTEAKQYKVLLLRKKGAVVAPVDGDGKTLKVTIGYNVVDAEVAKTVDVFVPEAYEVPVAAAAPEAGAETPAPKAKKDKGETKIAKCRAIYAASPEGTLKADIVARFVNEAGCTPAGANTYYVTLSKE